MCPRHVQIAPELAQESEYDRAVRQFFTQIAGDNLEVDWRELKDVLDYALKKGTSPHRICSTCLC